MRSRVTSMTAAALAAFTIVSVVLASGCAVVPQNRRRYLEKPTMPAQDDPVETYAKRNFHSYREAASGGDGRPAGGGCACGN